MDSLSQMVLGSAVTAAIVPARHRRAALLAGAALGTVPDLDVLPILLITDDPVTLMTMHRSVSHSLFVLPVAGWLIWWMFKRRGKRVADAPGRWCWSIQLALITHPLLDAFTAYGTQLLWPMRPPPVMWSSVFIIDPLYTVWLLAACVVAWVAPARRPAQHALIAGLIVSTAYLGWSLVAKDLVEKRAAQDLAALGLAEAPRVSVAMPFNTLLWRVVAMTPQGYVIGDRSLVADTGAIQFTEYPSDIQALSAVRGMAAVDRLLWFNRGFMRAQVVGDALVLSDLRLGQEPDYRFSFVVAERAGQSWREVPPRQLRNAYRWPTPDGGVSKALADMWRRIWQAPARPTGDPVARVVQRGRQPSGSPRRPPRRWWPPVARS